MAQMTQKEIAQQIDAAAARAADPATGKQVWFIAGLMVQHSQTPADWSLDPAHTMASLSKRGASALIDRIRESAAMAQ